MDFKPINTGRKTKAGRILWQNPESGELYSEKSMTIPLDIDKNTGEPLPGSRWANVPSVFDGGQILNDEDFLRDFYIKNKLKDPLTGRKLDIFKDLDTAVEAAKKRSSSLIDD